MTVMLRRSLSSFCFCVCFLWIFLRNPPEDITDVPVHPFSIDLSTSIAVQSLTAILPVPRQRLSTLADVLVPFLSPSKLYEVVIVIPESELAAARAIVREFVALLEDFSHPDFTLRVWPNHLDQASAVLRAALQITSEWLLILDEAGLTVIQEDTRALLLNPPAHDLPVGPRGIHRSICLTPINKPQPATYLLPPFTARRSVIYTPPLTVIETDNPWLQFGLHVALEMDSQHGGVSISMDKEPDLDWCIAHGSGFQDLTFQDTISSKPLFAIILPRASDFRAFNSVPCSLQARGFLLFLAIYPPFGSYEDRSIRKGTCTLHLTVIPDPNSYSPLIHRQFGRDPDVIISLDYAKPQHSSIPWIGLPRKDIAYSGWMKTLTFHEWQNWYKPRIDVSLITKDRPESLTRLLNSLASAHYFGDTLNMRINMEQSADEATMSIVQSFKWPHGNIFLHHRIIHGGLLPAVVESWYPSTNDSYGLLLEDDVELSPLFYAWIKMTVLHYQYGSDSNKSPQLFGISLYQQKHNELHMAGRQLFSAPALFQTLFYPQYTPYVSQVPCSWGAVYFPSHWRLFHSYLTLRFSQNSFSIDTEVVPDVRSNRWTKSWKRFFIEFAYLSGYVMLYPNYPDLVSLSTNHLEIGDHVKGKDKAKEELFNLPLMSDAHAEALLDFPEGVLPPWDELPSLNLTGSLITSEEMLEVGRLRLSELTGCLHGSTFPEYDIQTLMGGICGM